MANTSHICIAKEQSSTMYTENDKAKYIRHSNDDESRIRNQKQWIRIKHTRSRDFSFIMRKPMRLTWYPYNLNPHKRPLMTTYSAGNKAADQTTNSASNKAADQTALTCAFVASKLQNRVSHDGTQLHVQTLSNQKISVSQL